MFFTARQKKAARSRETRLYLIRGTRSRVLTRPHFGRRRFFLPVPRSVRSKDNTRRHVNPVTYMTHSGVSVSNCRAFIALSERLIFRVSVPLSFNKYRGVVITSNSVNIVFKSYLNRFFSFVYYVIADLIYMQVGIDVYAYVFGSIIFD